ncbi:riboflavin biosynthesis protein RibF [Horticoccus luteus]|uniref:Riboflavin biosynthesis protein n=1 Tax=Horticoccus luteus TaxID=2862869 RepID=A0A8F9TYU2_9BACT|nr:riboflavin biosynthesis protein RibF [Horticoccus luteus]QYM80374.1 riboflavin biosynthesis protein RibF [Horticoccus luteus]
MNSAAEFAGLDCAALPPRPVHLAIGMFDGVHRGHRTVIEAAVTSARQAGGVAAVLTFFPHPSAIFRRDDCTQLILPAAAKRRVLETLGVEAIITEPFTPEFSQIPAEEFLPLLRAKLPRLAGIYVGENWRFGRGRRGDAALLVREGRAGGISVFTAARVSWDGKPISSTRIRSLLVKGDVAAANKLLGYAYFAEGVVKPGKRLGRQLGFPTLNLDWAPECRPALGVYAVEVRGIDGRDRRNAVANFGLRPTVEPGATEPRLEVHVLGDCPFGEGDALLVDWRQFLRPEVRFAGVEQLQAQIARDRDAAAAFFAR